MSSKQAIISSCSWFRNYVRGHILNIDECLEMDSTERNDFKIENRMIMPSVIESN